MPRITLPKVTDLEQTVIEAGRTRGRAVGEISRLTGLPYTTVYFYAIHGGIPAEAMTPAEAARRGVEARRLKKESNGKNGA